VAASQDIVEKAGNSSGWQTRRAMLQMSSPRTGWPLAAAAAAKRGDEYACSTIRSTRRLQFLTAARVMIGDHIWASGCPSAIRTARRSSRSSCGKYASAWDAASRQR
jgi:hypothetical protein